MTEDLNTLREALERLEEYARLLGATQAKKGFGVYTDGDSRLERTWHEGIANCKVTAIAALDRLEAAADHVPDAGKMVPELSREDVVRLAREAGFGVGHAEAAITLFQRFASLVRSVPVGEVKPVGEMIGHHKVGFGEMPTIRWADGYWPQVGTKFYTTPPAPIEGWRPIETAPKDHGSTTFDVWANGERYPDCWWGKATYEKGDSGIVYQSDYDCNGPVDSYVRNATHWMPLPAAPQPGDKP